MLRALRLPHGRRTAHMRIPRRPCWLLLLLLAGCNRQDTESLQSITHKVLSRADALTGEVKSSTPPQWHGNQEMALDARVTARLRWDKQLADVPLEVKAIGNTIEIHG